jgi:alginate O-acetyltransferase complex protein AlgI
MIYTDVLFIGLLASVWLTTEALRPWRSTREWAIIIFSLFVIATWGLFSLVLLLAVATTNFAIVRLAISLEQRQRSLLLGVAVALDLAALATFKYAGFFETTLDTLLHVKLPVLSLGLPLAISFYTFHLISYLVDLGRGKTRVLNLRQFLFYVTFFPHVIAGPIVRTWQLVPQLGKNRRLRRDLPFALHYFVVGVFLKSIVANNIAASIDPVWSSGAAQSSAADLWLTAVLYYFQIYSDFAGYTLLALGMARLFGYRLPVNFRAPLLATSLQDFWRRWHITLSRWLRDYLYIPLGGNRRGFVRGLVNVFLTFLLGGLWHGAGWNFVLWGAMHGAGLAGERLLKSNPQTSRTARGLFWLTTQIWVTLTWVFFRSSTFDGAIAYVVGMFQFAKPDALALHIPDLPPLLLIASGAVIHQLTPLWLRYVPRKYLGAVLGFVTAVLFVIDIVVISPSKVFIYFAF